MVAFGNQDSSQVGIGMFSSELVYGAPLTVTGNFIANNGTGFQLQCLENRYAHWPKFLPIDMAHHRYMFQASSSTKFVFIHRDSQCTSLQGNYQCPFVVIESGPVIFKIDIGSSQRTSLLSG